MSGLRVRGPLPAKNKFDIHVRVAEGRVATIHGQIQWINRESDSYGVSVITDDFVWQEYVAHLNFGFEILAEPPKCKKVS